jgi:hypothetical protein
VAAACREFSHLVNKAALLHRCIACTSGISPPRGSCAPGRSRRHEPGRSGTVDQVVFLQYSQTGLDLDEFAGPKERLLNFCRMPANWR